MMVGTMTSISQLPQRSHLEIVEFSVKGRDAGMSLLAKGSLGKRINFGRFETHKVQRYLSAGIICQVRLGYSVGRFWGNVGAVQPCSHSALHEVGRTKGKVMAGSTPAKGKVTAGSPPPSKPSISGGRLLPVHSPLLLQGCGNIIWRSPGLGLRAWPMILGQWQGQSPL